MTDSDSPWIDADSAEPGATPDAVPASADAGVPAAPGRSAPAPPSHAAAEMKKARDLETQRNSMRLIQKVRCPVHQQAARNVKMQMYGGKVKWTFDKCCAELERALMSALQRQR